MFLDFRFPVKRIGCVCLIAKPVNQLALLGNCFNIFPFLKLDTIHDKKTGENGSFTEFPGPVGWLKNLGWEDTFRQIHDRCDPQKKPDELTCMDDVQLYRVHVYRNQPSWSFGMPWRILMRLGMPLAFIGCRTNGLSD